MKIIRARTIDIARISARISFVLVGAAILSACSGSGIGGDGGAVKQLSENFNSRVSIIVIHHTTENFEDSLRILTKRSSRPVSSHYLVPEPNDETYPRKKLKVFELVPETQRAWHAGRSYWAGKEALNDQSIGIELVNQTYCRNHETEAGIPNGDSDSATSGAGNIIAEIIIDNAEPPRQLCFYPDFPETQIDILIDLLRDIQGRHPDIKPTNIVGHADIAPDRRIDPGPRFPWERLYQLGIGAWFDDETVAQYWGRFIETPLPLINVQKALRTYGYNVDETGVLDEQTRHVLRAFQMHFRPSLVTSEPTLESTAILYALIEKYHPEELDELLVIAAPPEDTVAADCENEPESDSNPHPGPSKQ